MGHVTDALTGEPVAGIGVHAGYWYDHWRGGYWEWINATTDEQGDYIIAGLWAGTWPVSSQIPRCATSPPGTRMFRSAQARP